MGQQKKSGEEENPGRIQSSFSQRAKTTQTRPLAKRGQDSSMNDRRDCQSRRAERAGVILDDPVKKQAGTLSLSSHLFQKRSDQTRRAKKAACSQQLQQQQQKARTQRKPAKVHTAFHLFPNHISKAGTRTKDVKDTAGTCGTPLSLGCRRGSPSSFGTC